MISVCFSLGSNLGDRAQTLAEALSCLRQQVQLLQVSSLYETAPVGYADQPAFLNLACEGRTTLPPDALLRFVKQIEQHLGRQATFRYGPRLIDVDIVLYGGWVVSTPALSIPHPRMTERAFVLAPLAEIAPDARHPVLAQPINELLTQVDDTGVQRLTATLPPAARRCEFDKTPPVA